MGSAAPTIKTAKRKIDAAGSMSRFATGERKAGEDLPTKTRGL